MKRMITLLLLAALALTAFGCAGKPSAVTGAFSKSDLGIELSGKRYYLREDSADAIKALGDGYEYSETLSCVYEGQDKTFTYDGLIVSTVPVNQKDVVEMFTLTSPAYTTLRGAKVGDTRDAVIALYGEDYFDDGYLTYSLTNDPSDIQAERIQFEFSGDAVSKIYIYSPSY